MSRQREVVDLPDDERLDAIAAHYEMTRREALGMLLERGLDTEYGTVRRIQGCAPKSPSGPMLLLDDASILLAGSAP